MLSTRLQGVNLYLIGMMGAGKTTLGRVLAQQLEYRFLDTDEAIAAAARQSIPEIFATSGEEGFREWETAVLSQVVPFPRLVVATGGGIVLRSANWGHLHHGLTLWLDVPTDELYRRLTADSTPRPLLATPDPLATLTNLLEQRRSLYAQADIHIPIDSQTPEALLADIGVRIQAVLQDDLPPNPPTSNGASPS
jgi:shikimate kinase